MAITIDPEFREFQEAFVTVSSNDVDPLLIGQPLSIRLNISATQVDRSSHFDNVRLTGCLVPGDCDGDGDVDLDDYACFHPCIAGPEGGLMTGCDPFDVDDDGDVDLMDFAAFQSNNGS